MPPDLARDLTAPTLPARLRAGSIVGALCGATPAVLLLALLLLVGPEVPGRHGGTVRADLAAVLMPIAGAVGGALLAAGYPYVRHARAGRVALAALAASPWAAAMQLATNHGYRAWTTVHSAAAALMALAIGGALGWNVPMSRRQRRREARRRRKAKGNNAKAL